MTRSIIEISGDKVALIVDYFLNSTSEHLLKLGINETKLPGRTEWIKIITDDLEQPFEKRKFFFLLWLINGIPVGHSHINDIKFGKEAYMHLHLWDATIRQKGNGTYFITESLKIYFSKFNLQKIYCQPNAFNDAPNKTLEKTGFEFIKKYETTPGWLNLKQFVNLWVLEKKRFYDRILIRK